MKTFEVKNIELSVKDVDVASRRVQVVLNRTGVKDSDDDIIEATAFDNTIKERGPKGKNLIWHLTDHYPSLKNAVGKFSELSMQGADLVGTTVIPTTTWGNDVMQFYQTGTINQHSIGFSTIKKEVINEDDPETRYQVLKEIRLYEGSAVLWGANEFTPTLSVGKSLTKEDLKSEFTRTMDELGGFYKMFKLGHLSDDTYELIEMRISQLSQKIQHLFTSLPADAAVGTSLPADTAVDSESKELLEVLKTFSNNLKSDDNDHKRRTAAAA